MNIQFINEILLLKLYIIYALYAGSALLYTPYCILNILVGVQILGVSCFEKSFSSG